MRPIQTFKITLGCLLLLLPFRGPVRGAESPGASVKNQTAMKTDWLVYIGTYTGAKSKGIYFFRMNAASGAQTPPALAVEARNPAFLDIDARNHLLLAANEINSFEGKSTGAVSAFASDPVTGKLTLLNQQPSAGTDPCHLLLDKENKNVLVANYSSGSVAVLPVQPDGKLGAATTILQHIGKSIHPERQTGPHAHCVTLDAANHFAFVCDLGLDKIMTYQFDAQRGTLSPANPSFTAVKAGAGPRHLVFHPDGRHAYVINELNSTITALAYDSPRGVLTELQTLSTLPDGFTGNNSTAEVQVHPSGKFLYGSNRGHDSLAVFAIDSDKGTLTPVEYRSTQGKKPRHFAIDPTGKFLLVANQDSDAIVTFSIDPATGRLQPTGQVLEVPAPVCIRFMPAGPATE
jgi:6-phosphogluconolactonase